MPRLPLALQSVGRAKNESSAHFLNQHEEDERREDGPASPMGIFHQRLKGARPWKVMPFVDKVPLSFEINSGSAKSITGSDAFDKPNKEAPPRPTDIYISHCRHTQEACPPHPPHSSGSVCESFA